MDKIRYHPLINCDTEGKEKRALFPSEDPESVTKFQGSYLLEMISDYYRLYAGKDKTISDSTKICCPKCGLVMRQLTKASDKNKLGLYTCEGCRK